MRRFICLMLALVVFASLAMPAFAVEGEFVPSIAVKDGPVIKDATMNGDDVGDCLIVTSIAEAKDKSTDITQDERDLLLDVYKKLKDGSMVLPLNTDYVIRDLVDVSFKYDDCRQQDDHGNKDQWLAKEGNTVTVTFKLGIGKKTDVSVLTYVDGKWVKAEKVVNNGDGTVTVTFEDICPVAFAVGTAIPKTGDVMGQNLGLWIGLLAVSAVALVAVVVVSRKKRK